MKRLVGLLIFSLFCFSQTAEDVALKVEAKLRSTHSIQAKFDHIYYSSSVSTPLKEKGNFYFKRPGRMKWEYKRPEERTYLLKNSFLLEYIPEDNQIIKYDLSKESHEPEILTLLSGQKRIADNYFLEFSPFPSDNPKAIHLKLTPKQENDYSYLLLEVDEKTWLIRKIIFFDWAGNKTEFQFNQIKINVRFPQKLFELKVPPGVEIIEY